MRGPLHFELNVAFVFALLEARVVLVIVKELELGRTRPTGDREFGVWRLV